MIGRELERDLAEITPFGAAAIDHTARALRTAELLPIGGRGFSAPRLTPQHAANLLIALAAAEMPAAAVAAVNTYNALEATWSGIGKMPSHFSPFQNCNTFGGAMAALLNDVQLCAGVDSIHIFRTWPRAVIEMKDGPKYFYGIAEHDKGATAGMKIFTTAVIVRYAISMLSQIALELSDHGNSGRIATRHNPMIKSSTAD